MRNLRQFFRIEPITLPYALQYFSQFTYFLICIYMLGWSRYWHWYLGAISLSFLLNGVAFYFLASRDRGKFLVSLSPVIIATSISLFVTCYSFFSYFLPVTIAILSKFLIRVDGRHIFNPTSIALITLVAYGEGVYSVPVVMGTNPKWLIYFLLMGTATTFFAGRIVASYTYIAIFAALQGALLLLGDPSSMIHLASLMSVASLLFVFHFFTDPKTSPANRLEQVYFGGMIAVFDVILRQAEVMASPLVALTLTSSFFALVKASRSATFSRFLPIGTVATILIFGMTWGYFPPPRANIYGYGIYQPTESHAEEKAPFEFEDETRETGLDYLGVASITTVRGKDKGKSLAFNYLNAPGIAVGDFDRDGYADILSVGDDYGFFLMKNEGGRKFADVTERAGLGDLQRRPMLRAFFFDYNNDGYLDIFAVDGRNRFLLAENQRGKFAAPKPLPGDVARNSGVIKSIGFVDYDRDGFLDVILANFPAVLDDTAPKAPKPAPKTYVLKNHGGKYFSDESVALGFSGADFNHVIGISDMNEDGWPDLYYANDFNRDRLFLNQGGKRFQEQTRSILGPIRGRAGMGAEFADIDENGHQSLYVSQASTGRFRHGQNYLWQKQTDGTFANVADDYGLGRCGFSWGAKFMDPDLDGKLDLFVASGLKSGNKPIWFLSGIWNTIPNFLKSNLEVLKFLPEDADNAGHQRSCFFWNRDRKFTDVAPTVGLGDVIDGHSVVLIDMDNSGTQSVVVGSFRNSLHIFRPRLESKPNWLGIRLRGTSSNREGLGAKVSLLGRKAAVREAYFNNSVASQSDPRLVFGLGKESGAMDVLVQWPSGKQQTVKALTPNRYHEIVER